MTDPTNPLTTALPEEAFQTEQFKSTPPSDPVEPAAEPEKVTLVDIPAAEPYPTGGVAEEPAPKGNKGNNKKP